MQEFDHYSKQSNLKKQQQKSLKLKNLIQLSGVFFGIVLICDM